jgi:hypothetical protein
MRSAPVSLAYSRGRSGRVLAQQSHEPAKQRATDHHGPVPDIQLEKPAIPRYKSELHARPLPKTNPPPNGCSITASGKRPRTVKIDGPLAI